MQEKNDNPPPPLPPKKFIRTQNSVRYEQPNVHEPHSIHTKQPDNPSRNPTTSPPGSIRSKNTVRYEQPTVVNEKNSTLTKLPASPPGSIRSKTAVLYEQPTVFNEQNPTLTKQSDNPLFNPIASPPGSIRSKNAVRYEQPTVFNEQNPTLTQQPGEDQQEGQTEKDIINFNLVKCDKCQNYVIPIMEYKIGCCAVSCILGLILFAILGVFFIVWFFDRFKDKHYKCPNCDHTLLVQNRCCMR